MRPFVRPLLQMLLWMHVAKFLDGALNCRMKDILTSVRAETMI